MVKVIIIIITICYLHPHRADDQEVAQGDHQADEAQGHQRTHHLGNNIYKAWAGTGRVADNRGKC